MTSSPLQYIESIEIGLLSCHSSASDSTTGYIFNVKIDYGNPNLEQLPPGVTKTSNLVLQLMESHLDRGYHVFVDRLYNSVALAEELQRRKTSITGTVMANRKGLPAEIKTKLKKGEIISLRKGQLLALLWQDKRPISILSTYCNGDEVIEIHMCYSCMNMQCDYFVYFAICYPCE
uniref:piggyBac transposable element-derived protein 4-like n=1 Tax=Styela clava TaxID=7725 RepID=UPI001939E519|nr:piggyBac transposable element-derived protein 4-like [Styela clava]